MVNMTCTAVILFVAVMILGARGLPFTRSDDIPPIETLVQNLSSQVTDLQAKLTVVENTLQHLQAAERQQVVFTATIADHNVKAVAGHVIPFSRVITNVGNAYDASTSTFAAPYDGEYVVFVSLDVGPDYKKLDIYRNGRTVIPGHNDGDDHHIFAGDEVTIRHGSSVVGAVDGRGGTGSNLLWL